MPFAQKYDMYKYVDTCTHAIWKSVHALKYMLLDAFGAKEIYFLHIFYGSCFFPTRKENFINVTYPRLKPPSALRIS